MWPAIEGDYRSSLIRQTSVQEAAAVCFAHQACHMPR
jgi:hypothetical protein